MPNSFASTEEIIQYEIFTHCSGITSLLGSGVYLAAYPLHDVSTSVELFLRIVSYLYRTDQHCCIIIVTPRLIEV